MKNIVAKTKAAMNTASAKWQTAKLGLSTAMMMGMCASTANGMMYADAGGDLFDAFWKVVTLIVTVIGVMLMVVGIVKYAMSHSEGDGPAQNKAIAIAATGLVLVLLPNIIPSGTLKGIITGAGSTGAGPK